MKRIEQIKRSLRGEIKVPGDKSIGHRAVIFASIAHGQSRIFNLSGGEDNLRTVQAFKDMGVEIRPEDDGLRISGRGWEGLSGPGETIDCGNSGTAMRLLSGVLAGRPFEPIGRRLFASTATDAARDRPADTNGSRDQKSRGKRPRAS